jgi:hypothetical protein
VAHHVIRNAYSTHRIKKIVAGAEPRRSYEKAFGWAPICLHCTDVNISLQYRTGAMRYSETL